MSWLIKICTSFMCLGTIINCYAQKNTFTKINVTDKDGLKQGFWIEHQAYGMERSCEWQGEYENGRRFGRWEFHLPGGFLGEVDEYHTYDSTRTETIYYNNNQIKSVGKYKSYLINKSDTTIVIDPISGKEKTIISNYGFFEKKVGKWKYYTETGEIEKEESH